MNKKKIFIIVLFLLFSFVCIFVGSKSYEKRHVRSLAINLLRSELPREEYEKYELSEMRKKDGEWYVWFINKKDRGILGNDIMIVVNNNKAELLDSE